MTARSLLSNAPDRCAGTAGEATFSEVATGTHRRGVVDGSVRLRVRGAVAVVLSQHDVFGERALIDDRPRDLATVAVAVAPTAHLRAYGDWIASLVEGEAPAPPRS